MKGLTGQEPEAVLYELSVLGIYRSLTDFRAVVTFVVEERMAYPVEVNTDLMCPSCLQTTLHNSHITEALQNAVMRHSMLSMIPFRKDLEAHTVVGVTADITDDCTLVILEIAPYDGHITPFDRMDEELLCKIDNEIVAIVESKK